MASIFGGFELYSPQTEQERLAQKMASSDEKQKRNREIEKMIKIYEKESQQELTSEMKAFVMEEGLSTNGAVPVAETDSSLPVEAIRMRPVMKEIFEDVNYFLAHNKI